jgi:predicted hydrocarbon binding protein
MKWLSGGKEFRVNESKCVAMGDNVCEFIIEKTPMR